MMTKRATAAGLLCLLIATNAQPAAGGNEPPISRETTGDVVLFPGPLGPLVSHSNQHPTAGGPGRRAGWHIAGGQYRAGVGWWALVCAPLRMQGGDGKDCALHSTSLQVLRARHPAYDSDPVPSQLLHWSPLPANLDKLERKGEVRPDLIAIFKPIRSLAALKLGAGPVKTYAHRGMANYLHTGRPGTLEVRLEMGGGGHADLIPRLGQADATQQGAIFEEHPFSTLELRVGDMRQQLPGFGWQVMDETATLRPQDFLRWAGDLDGDGKLDLILDQSGGGGRIALYLSSLAKKGELVGLAGTFEYFDPSASGC